MLNLLNLYRQTLVEGYLQDNRTTTPAIVLPYGAVLTYDMNNGFPVPTTKEVNWRASFAEMIGFLRGYDNAQQFAALGCRWWGKDANTNTQWLASRHRAGEGDMGRAYGVQWRRWTRSDGRPPLDQLQNVLDQIRNDPHSRRIIISAWRPDELDQMCLPPCHVAYKFMVNVAKGELSMSLWQRSSDLFLGVPMNITGACLMLHMVAAATGLKPRWFTHHLDDIHIYTDHIEQVKLQSTREPLRLPSLSSPRYDLLGADADTMANIPPQQYALIGYEHHPAISGEMSTG